MKRKMIPLRDQEDLNKIYGCLGDIGCALMGCFTMVIVVVVVVLTVGGALAASYYGGRTWVHKPGLKLTLFAMRTKNAEYLVPK